MISRNIETQTEKEIGNLTVQKKNYVTDRRRKRRKTMDGSGHLSVLGQRVTTLHWTPKASSRYSPSTGQNDAR